MYGIPADFDCSIFVGKELTLVSFTVNTVYLDFDGEISITLLGAFVIQSKPEADSVRQAPPIDSSSLMALVGQQVRSADSTAEGTLILRFESGASLACLDDSMQYESYYIRVPGKEIIV